MKQRGIVLVAAIMLIVFVSFAVLGVATFIVQRFSQFNSRDINTRCIYLAQAGINQALYYFRFRDLSANGYFSAGQANIDANNYFILGGTMADFLMLNSASAAFPGPQFRDLSNLTLQNATDNRTVTIDRMIVSWVKSGAARRLSAIRIDNSNVWTGNASSPANADITNVNLTTATASVNYLRFSGDMTGTTSVTIQFVMSDGSTKTMQVYPDPGNNFNFTVKSTGRVTGSNIYRTIQVDYNALTARVTNYNEINTQMLP